MRLFFMIWYLTQNADIICVYIFTNGLKYKTLSQKEFPSLSVKISYIQLLLND